MAVAALPVVSAFSSASVPVAEGRLTVYVVLSSVCTLFSFVNLFVPPSVSITIESFA